MEGYARRSQIPQLPILRSGLLNLFHYPLFSWYWKRFNPLVKQDNSNYYHEIVKIGASPIQWSNLNVLIAQLDRATAF